MFNFISTLSDFVQAGHIFVISGYASHDAEEFKILLSCGKVESANVALKVSANFNSRKILRSSIVGGSCTCEEDNENLTCEGAMPLKTGEMFTFCILVGDDRFHVALNDEPYCTYKFQMPCNQIKSLIISGDIETLVKVNHVKTFPFTFPTIKSDCEDLAFEGFIPRELDAGDVMTIQGVVSGKPDGEFVIMFLEDETHRQMIHFNPRFDEQCVVVNSMDCDEEWTDNEARSSSLPFIIGNPFKIAFAFTNNDVKIAVNGAQLINIPMGCIDIGSNESVWSVLTGCRVKNGVDMSVKINAVETIRTGDKNANGFEALSQLN